MDSSIVVFIALTIVKAYYIVSEFMHLGHEKKSLKMSIVLPMLFVVFFYLHHDLSGWSYS